MTPYYQQTVFTESAIQAYDAYKSTLYAKTFAEASCTSVLSSGLSFIDKAVACLNSNHIVPDYKDLLGLSFDVMAEDQYSKYAFHWLMRYNLIFMSLAGRMLRLKQANTSKMVDKILKAKNNSMEYYELLLYKGRKRELSDGEYLFFVIQVLIGDIAIVTQEIGLYPISRNSFPPYMLLNVIKAANEFNGLVEHYYNKYAKKTATDVLYSVILSGYTQTYCPKNYEPIEARRVSRDERVNAALLSCFSKPKGKNGRV